MRLRQRSLCLSWISGEWWLNIRWEKDCTYDIATEIELLRYQVVMDIEMEDDFG